MRLIRLLANLGYGSQKDVRSMLRAGRVTTRDGAELSPDSRVEHSDVLLDGEPIDPPPGVVLMMNKPEGYTCSTTDPGRIVYQLLPPRFARRNPIIAPVGRLDRDTSGLLLLTDDGALLHKVISPKSRIPKTYDVTLSRPLTGTEAGEFAGGKLVLRAETEPLLPATLEDFGDRRARLTIIEGRYHQVKRMFAAVDNHVEALHRSAIGSLTLGDLEPGKWRVLTPEEVEAVFR